MNLELAYQSELKEKQIDELKYTHNLQQQKIKNKSIQVYLLIVSVVLLAFFLSSMWVYWKKRRQIDIQQREQKFLQGRFEAEEKAKDKIAQELHDDIGGQMIGLIIQLESTGKLNIEETGQLRKVYQEIRRLSHSLDEPIFKEINLQDKLKNYFSELINQVEFEISFIDDIKTKWSTIKDHQEIQRNLYRIIQELITNTAKFAKATEVEVQLINDKSSLVLIYEDNGVGMDLADRDKKPHFNTIKKRIEMFNGKMEVNSEPQHGFFVNISIPFELVKENKKFGPSLHHEN
jgi:signal transduction histidine kinase